MEEPDKMTRSLYTPRPALTDLVLDQASSHDLAHWMRVALWCWGHADQHGHARTQPGELRTMLGVTDLTLVSRAVRIAGERRLIDPCSSAGCLVLAGQGLAPCEATHRVQS